MYFYIKEIMDYNKIYNRIIDQAKNRTLDEQIYYETHHIIPKCIGGLNDENNLVKLNYREHFICHWLLHKIYSENKSLEFAFKYMAFGNGYSKTKRLVPSSRILEENKIKLIQSFNTPEHKEKIRKGQLKNKNKESKTYTRSLEKYLLFCKREGIEP